MADDWTIITGRGTQSANSCKPQRSFPWTFTAANVQSGWLRIPHNLDVPIVGTVTVKNQAGRLRGTDDQRRIDDNNEEIQLDSFIQAGELTNSTVWTLLVTS